MSDYVEDKREGEYTKNKKNEGEKDEGYRAVI